jgi:hypothetical protein
MGSSDVRASLPVAALLFCVAGCQGAGTSNRDDVKQASAVAEQRVPGDIGDGIYEVIPRGPFHLDEGLKTKAS